MSVTISPDTASLNSMLDDLGEDIEAAIRPAAQAAAQVLYDQVKQNVRGLGRKTGNLDGAIYQAFSTRESGTGHATYYVSWNQKKAPHGQLVEFGHIQRYASYLGKDGRWHTLVRPEMRGKPRPARRASQAEKDAYYVVRKGGPKQIAARPFVRSAESKFNEALLAAEAVLLKRISK